MKSLIKPIFHTAQMVEAKGQINATVLDQKRLAAFVGLIALCLPPVLWLGSFVGPFCVQSSISHYYYLPFLGSIFVGSLGFIGVFMMCYPGHSPADFWMSFVGGFFALLVAIFPTALDGCASDTYTAQAFVERSLLNGAPQNSVEFDYILSIAGLEVSTKVIHALSAIVLFVILAWFALWSFRRDNGEGVSKANAVHILSKQKTWRNRIYLVSGLVIVLSLGVLLYLYVKGLTFAQGYTGDSAFPPFFFFEALVLMAFGFSWLVKGRLIPWLNDPGCGWGDARWKG